jgi:hypothetical protein
VDEDEHHLKAIEELNLRQEQTAREVGELKRHLKIIDARQEAIDAAIDAMTRRRR